MPKPKKQRLLQFDRLTILMLFLVVASFFVVGKLFKMQVLDYHFYSVLASDQHVFLKKLVPERGEVFLRDYHSDSEFPFIINRDVYDVYAVPRYIDDPERVAQNFLDIFPDTFEEEKLLYILSKENDPYEPLLQRVEEDKITLLNDADLEGIRYVPKRRRYYAHETLGAHIAGFVGQKDEIPTGLYGIEGYFNEELSGISGELKTEKDASGQWIATTDKKLEEAVDGADILLTLDKTVQYEVCMQLEQALDQYGATAGSVTIMDPHSGAVIALCGSPAFDPNHYNEVEGVDVYNNPTIFSTYEPGSIFKPLTLAGAIDAEKITPYTTYEDKGFVEADTFTIRNADEAVFGLVTMTQVLEESINTGTIYAMQLLGDDLFVDYVKKFGFGKKTGIQLDTESKGNISSIDKFSPVYRYTAAYGQGITVTPIQMVAAYGALANGGRLMKPYIVDEIRYADGTTEVTEPTVIRRVISERTSALIGGMLESVVKFGHGKAANIDGYAIAGKTGTAQIASTTERGYSDETIHSFIGYAPVDNPRFVMLTRLDRPTNVEYSSGSAAPLFGRIARFLLTYYKVPPTQ